MRDQAGEANNNYRHGQTVGGKRTAEYLRAAKARYRERHRAKHLAHKAVQTAIARKALTRQCCEVCGVLETHAHHDDYDKPLDVRWLCLGHHREAHAE